MNARPDKEQIETAETLPAAVPVQEAVAEKKKRRRPLRTVLMLALPLALAAGGSYAWVTGGRYISTEDAYVQQDRVTVMPQVSGQIAEVAVRENQTVEAGDLLFTIDDAAYSNAVEQARAKLESARLDVERLKAAYQQAVAAETTAREAFETAETQNERQQTLIEKGIVSEASGDETALVLQRAKGELSSATQQVLAAKAALAGDPDIDTDHHPEVLQALAELHAAELDLDHTTIAASQAGVVSQTDRLQVGQYVTPAVPVLSLVETGQSWIEANYKETELTDMHAGQPVEIEIDTYPDRPLHGTIASVGAGTGSEFALLPAQNATGNWVKVVQRIPVRIALDDGTEMPLLRAGMSASVTVDSGHSRGVPDFVEESLAALGLDEVIDLDGLLGDDVVTTASAAAQPNTDARAEGTAASAVADGQ